MDTELVSMQHAFTTLAVISMCCMPYLSLAALHAAWRGTSLLCVPPEENATGGVPHSFICCPYL